MEVKSFFPFWKELTEAQQTLLTESAQSRTVAEGTVLHSGSGDCLGLMLVRSGLLRAYIVSDEGREMTLYRLFPRDICLFSASCIMQSIQFDIIIEAEKETEVFVISPQVYKELTQTSLAVANYTQQLMSARFSEVMWLMEQIMWKSFDKRLAKFLLDQSEIEGRDDLKLTHEKIANHLGTAREVVTRMLKYFQNEGMVTLSRGAVTLTDRAALEALEV